MRYGKENGFGSQPMKIAEASSRLWDLYVISLCLRRMGLFMMFTAFERFLEDGRECAQRLAGKPERADLADDIVAVPGLIPVDDREHDLFLDVVLRFH